MSSVSTSLWIGANEGEGMNAGGCAQSCLSPEGRALLTGRDKARVEERCRCKCDRGWDEIKKEEARRIQGEVQAVVGWRDGLHRLSKLSGHTLGPRSSSPWPFRM